MQQELRWLTDQKVKAMREHEARMSEITERQQQTVFDAMEKRAEILHELASVRRKADAERIAAARDEAVRYKTECMTIENSRQQLFADYKAQKPEAEAEADNG